MSAASVSWIEWFNWIAQELRNAPRQQLVNTVDRMIGDMGQDMAQVSARVDTVEFAGSDERVHRRCTLAPAVGSSEEEIFSSMHIMTLSK